MDENTDFIAKLRQIEEQANLLGAELPNLARTRCQHIVLLARSLRGRLELGGVTVLRTDRSAPAPGAEGKPRV
jgi:hypothetical protein